jgi:hypothetical protein
VRGVVFRSLPPVVPAVRVNQPSVSGSYITNLFTGCGAGDTTTTFDDLYPDQALP